MINKEPLVSIIVPVFNSEDYLYKCVESLVAQDYKNIEVLLINDGSNSICSKLCDELSENNLNIHTYHKKNGGTSDAKNFGIDKANGEYILFVDSDDFIDKNYVTLLITPINTKMSVEMVVSGYKIDYLKDNYSIEARTNFDKMYIKKNTLREAIYDLDVRGLFNVAIGKIYKKSILLDENIRFNTDLSTGEDLVFNCDYFKEINTIKIIDEVPYHYIRRDVTSLVNTYRSDLISMVTFCNIKRRELYNYHNMKDGKFEEAYGVAYIENMAACIPNMYRANNDMKIREKISSIKHIIRDQNLKEFLKQKNNFNSFTNIFVKLCKTNSPVFIWFVYSILFFIRNNFGKIYRTFRREAFKN